MTAVNRERGCHNGRRPPFLSARPEPEPHEPAAGIWVAHRATISQPSADWGAPSGRYADPVVRLSPRGLWHWGARRV